MIKIMDKLLGVTMLAGMLLFLGVQPLYAYPIQANVSAYAEHGTMANGERTHEGAIAADDLPFGTHVIINGREYVVKDRFGGKVLQKGEQRAAALYQQGQGQQSQKNGQQLPAVAVPPGAGGGSI